MKIEELLSGKSDDQEITVDGISIPTQSLRKLVAEGYENLKVYEENHTLSLWGKTCSACFTEEQVREMR
ncbi:MAG: hypothetical protein ACLFUL_02150 [Desulfobacteraceae bacterium]